MRRIYRISAALAVGAVLALGCGTPSDDPPPAEGSGAPIADIPASDPGGPAAPISVGTCPEPPFFGGPGPPCTTERQRLECACSECMEWSPVLATGTYPAAEYYEIGRQLDAGPVEVVGSTRSRYQPAYTDELGVEIPAHVPTAWCFAWDEPMPTEGTLYRYYVRACVLDGAACSDWSWTSVMYRAAPYAVTFRPPVKAN